MSQPVGKEIKTEEQQVRAARKGDRTAFEWLVRKYIPLVGSVAYSVTGDKHVAEDVVQETFHKAYLRLDSLRDPRRIGSWLYGIARTTSVDWLRKHRGPSRGITADLEHAALAADDEAGPDEVATQNEEKRILHEALFELPDKYREVLVLKHLRDESYNDIARFLDTSVPAVESLLFRARSALRDVLRRRGIGRRPA